MSRIYFGSNGKTFDIDGVTSDFLTKLTAFLWNKIGVPAVVSQSDCNIISRMIRNYIKLMLVPMDDMAKKAIGYQEETMDNDERIYLEKISHFLDTSGGLIDSDNFRKKFNESIEISIPENNDKYTLKREGIRKWYCKMNRRNYKKELKKLLNEFYKVNSDSDLTSSQKYLNIYDFICGCVKDVK